MSLHGVGLHLIIDFYHVVACPNGQKPLEPGQMIYCWEWASEFLCLCFTKADVDGCLFDMGAVVCSLV